MAGKPAPLAKLLRPQLHRPVARQRLFRLLDRRATHPVLWVSGPPGCGKTTLVASYITSRRLPAAWYRVDEGDRDPAAFFTYLNLLARQFGSPDAPDLPTLSPEYFPDLAAFTRRCFRELFTRLPSRSMLVLDNCHAAASDTFHLLLRCACHELPPDISLVAISRSRRPGELAQLVASRAVAEIAWDELRFQPDEAAALGRGLGVQDPRLIDAWVTRCNGWAAGLVLLATRAEREPAAAGAGFPDNRDLFEYFATELLAAMPQSEREIMLATALLPQMTAAMAGELSGAPGAGELLQSLHRQQYFTDRMEGSEPVYRFHDLFRDFLLARLEEGTTPQHLRMLRTRAARILQARDQPDEALRLFRLAGQWPDVARLVRSHADMLLDRGQWRTLNEWLDGLPQAILDADPWLLYWRAQALLMLDVPASGCLARRAHEGFLRDGDGEGQVHVIALLIDVHWLIGEANPDWCDPAWVKVLEGYLAQPGSLPAAVEPRVSDAFAQLILWGGMRSSHMESVADRLEASLHCDSLPWGQRILASLMSLVYAMADADVERGRRISTLMAEHLEEPECSPVSRMWAAKILARWHFYAGEWEASVRYAARGRVLASHCRHPTQAVDSAHTQVSALCMLGRCQEARAIVATLDAEAGPPYSTGQAHRAHAFLAAHTGALERAAQHQQRATDLITGVGCRWGVAETTLLQAIFHISADQLAAGTAALRDAEERFTRSHLRFQESLLHLAHAELHLRQGDRALALQRLRAALIAAHNPVMAAALLWAGWLLPRLLAIALEEGIEPDFTRHLIRRFDLPPDAPTNQAWPWHVRIRALGTFQVLVEDRPTVAKGRPNFRLLEFLKAIVAAGGRNVSAITLAEWLWPDSEGDAAQNNLKVSLHRLRKFLRHDRAVTIHDGKVSLNPNLCWLDTWAFSAAPTGARGEPQSCPDRLCLYRGHFLDQESFPWALSERERLRARFHREALARADLLAAQGAWSEAAGALRALIEIDPTFEPFHLRLMQCLARAGRYGEATEAYRRCERTLRDALGVAPSRDTQSAYRSLRDQPEEVAR